MSPAPPSAIILMAPHSPRYKAPLTCKLHSFRSVDLDIVTSFFLLDTGLDKPTRNRDPALDPFQTGWMGIETERAVSDTCLLYTSDAADDLLCVDLGGRRIIKKKKKKIKIK